MSHNWIGIANDLTEEGVIGARYAEAFVPTTTTSANPANYPPIPNHGRAKTFLWIFLVVIVSGALTPPGSALLQRIFSDRQIPNKAPPAQIQIHQANEAAPHAPANINVEQVRAPSVQATAATTEDTGVRMKKPPRHTEEKHQSTPPISHPIGGAGIAPSQLPADSDVDLTKYRNLTGRI